MGDGTGGKHKGLLMKLNLDIDTHSENPHSRKNNSKLEEQSNTRRYLFCQGGREGRRERGGGGAAEGGQAARHNSCLHLSFSCGHSGTISANQPGALRPYFYICLILSVLAQSSPQYVLPLLLLYYSDPAPPLPQLSSPCSTTPIPLLLPGHLGSLSLWCRSTAVSSSGYSNPSLIGNTILFCQSKVQVLW